jgi:hypothetical protein
MIVDIGKTYLRGIPHKGKHISFEYPAYRGNYGDIAEKIDGAGLRRPSSSEIASLLRDAWRNRRGEYESKILNISVNDWLLEFSGNLYIPKSREEISDCVLIEYNPFIMGNKLIMDKDSLVRRLQKNDPLVKFVPLGFKTGEQSSRELAKNPYIIARYGEEGARKIARTSVEYMLNPELNLMSIFTGSRGGKPEMSVLHDNFGKGLHIFCGWDSKDICHSFGRTEKK